MAQRKLQQEMDKTFKKVAEGIVVFDGILEKIDNASNASQKDKLEDALKREIKKLQRQRDQIKTWAASNEIKDKKPLAEQRKNIEVCMEKFKAVEKEMKTKAFSKEGLSAPGKRDPKEQEKEDAGDFLAEMTASLESQLEALEAEEERLLASKKGKKDTKNADRLSEISRKTEQHKFHIGKLELFRRSLENGNIEPEQVQEKKEDIQYYVNDNASVDFMEMDAEDMYEGLNLQEEDGAYGVSNENDRVSSQDTQSVADEPPEASDSRTTGTGKPKSTSVSEPQGTGARRPSNNLKSPLPALATLHTPMPSITNGATKDSMKPAPIPTRPPGETLKYASAAAAAAASDKAAVGIAPLPPPPGTTPAPTTTTTSSSTGPSGLSAVPQTQKSSTTSSPSVAPSLPASSGPTPLQSSVLPVATDPSTIERTAPSHASEKSNLTSLPKPSPAIAPSNESRNVSGSSIPQPSMLNGTKQTNSTPLDMSASPAPTDASVVQRTNGEGNRPHEAESVYHLPPGLQDLIQSFEITKSRAPAPDSPSVQRLLAASHATRPDYTDAEKPRHYRPDTTYASPLYHPQEPFHNADEPNLYNRIDTDTLFYIFYYRQNTYQQYLAAKALKSQSWRFHKQYQTWFQRHEEPKTITEEFEQGTYRFFDYESTWMNRRKADFKFAYKFLEDDL